MFIFYSIHSVHVYMQSFLLQRTYPTLSRNLKHVMYYPTLEKANTGSQAKANTSQHVSPFSQQHSALSQEMTYCIQFVWFNEISNNIQKIKGLSPDTDPSRPSDFPSSFFQISVKAYLSAEPFQLRSRILVQLRCCADGMLTH